jgi:hypothetical protein
VRVRSGPATVTRAFIIIIISKRSGKSGRLPALAAVASRVRRPNPDMPRAWTPAGRV